MSSNESRPRVLDGRSLESAASKSRTLSAADSEQLRLSNARLAATVQELKLEISYYKGETKRLELEKNLLSQDVSRMSSLFKNWLTELQASNARSVINYLSNIVKNPCRSICELLQHSDQILFVTSCQSPYHIEVSAVFSIAGHHSLLMSYCVAVCQQEMGGLGRWEGQRSCWFDMLFLGCDNGQRIRERCH